MSGLNSKKCKLVYTSCFCLTKIIHLTFNIHDIAWKDVSSEKKLFVTILNIQFKDNIDLIYKTKYKPI